jgi:hypothetical protein
LSTSKTDAFLQKSEIWISGIFFRYLYFRYLYKASLF